MSFRITCNTRLVATTCRPMGRKYWCNSTWGIKYRIIDPTLIPDPHGSVVITGTAEILARLAGTRCSRRDREELRKKFLTACNGSEFGDHRASGVRCSCLYSQSGPTGYANNTSPSRPCGGAKAVLNSTIASRVRIAPEHRPVGIVEGIVIAPALADSAIRPQATNRGETGTRLYSMQMQLTSKGRPATGFHARKQSGERVGSQNGNYFL
ncbi:hypothetical protein BKA62DRAFT_676956 [Auriculariales sp. MPI-PUGE-AT-0066]|nr:hypothetical protein BKA62DRAFT_676956 [Auriculariales sp. MPI-PUGE-AT-0066]